MRLKNSNGHNLVKRQDRETIALMMMLVGDGLYIEYEQSLRLHGHLNIAKLRADGLA